MPPAPGLGKTTPCLQPITTAMPLPRVRYLAIQIMPVTLATLATLATTVIQASKERP